MKRAVVSVMLLVIAAGIIGFQSGAYHTIEDLFIRTSSTQHPASGNGGSNDSSASASSTHRKDSNSTSSSNLIKINAIINYGNRAPLWFNQSVDVSVRNFYNLTLVLTHNDVTSTFYSTWNPPEHFVTGISGVLASPGYYWSLWKFCPNSNAWAYAPVGADQITLSNNGTYGWYYQSLSTTNPPVQGAAVVVLDQSSFSSC